MPARKAARLLDQMTAGTATPKRRIFPPPREVCARKSTGALAIADRDVALALRFIRENGRDPIDVEKSCGSCPRHAASCSAGSDRCWAAASTTRACACA